MHIIAEVIEVFVKFYNLFLHLLTISSILNSYIKGNFSSKLLNYCLEKQGSEFEYLMAHFPSSKIYFLAIFCKMLAVWSIVVSEDLVIISIIA